MSNCYILKKGNYKSVRNGTSFLCFKHQNIFGTSNNFESIVGSELIIDMERTKKLGLSLKTLKNLEKFGECDHFSLDYASIYMGKNTYFISVENCSLCDVKFLNRIVCISQQMHHIGIELVIEVKRNNACSHCSKINESLSYLKSEGVVLAMDNFDCKNDYLNISDTSIYKYLKINYPSRESDEEPFAKFINNNVMAKKIIVKGIDFKEQLQKLNFNKIWGLQGVHFCKGVSLSRLSSLKYINR